jgi:hypothetical protein
MEGQSERPSDTVRELQSRVGTPGFEVVKPGSGYTGCRRDVLTGESRLAASSTNCEAEAHLWRLAHAHRSSSSLVSTQLASISS